MALDELPIYDTGDVARELGVSVRQARNICNSLFRQRRKYSHHRLTSTQLRAVQRWHRKFRKKRLF